MRDWFKIEITNFVNPPSTRRVDYGWKAKIEDESKGRYFETGMYNMLNENIRKESYEEPYALVDDNYYYYWASFKYRTHDTKIE